MHVAVADIVDWKENMMKFFLRERNLSEGEFHLTGSFRCIHLCVDDDDKNVLQMVMVMIPDCLVVVAEERSYYHHHDCGSDDEVVVVDKEVEMLNHFVEVFLLE